GHWPHNPRKTASVGNPFRGPPRSAGGETYPWSRGSDLVSASGEGRARLVSLPKPQPRAGEGPPRPRWSTPMRPPTMVGASPSGDAVSGHTGTGRSPCGALPHGDRPGRTVLSGSKALVLNRRRFPAPEHWERPDRSLSRPTGSRACVSGFFAGPGTGCRCGRSGVAGLGAGGVVVQA